MVLYCFVFSDKGGKKVDAKKSPSKNKEESPQIRQTRTTRNAGLSQSQSLKSSKTSASQAEQFTEPRLRRSTREQLSAEEPGGKKAASPKKPEPSPKSSKKTTTGPQASKSPAELPVVRRSVREKIPAKRILPGESEGGTEGRSPRRKSLNEQRKSLENERGLRIMLSSFECVDCGQKFSRLDMLEQHKTSHQKRRRVARGADDSSIQNCFVCAQCLSVFLSSELLDQHRSTAHSSSSRKTSKSRPRGAANPTSTDTRIRQRTTANSKMSETQIQKVLENIKVDADNDDDDDGDNDNVIVYFSDDEWDDGVKQQSNDNQSVSTPSGAAETTSAFPPIRHSAQTQSVSDPRVDPVSVSAGGCQCLLCNEQFEDVQAWTAHQTERHGTSQELYTCEACDVSFSTEGIQAHLRDHHPDTIQTISTGEYTCKLCLLSFVSQQDLERHEVKEHDYLRKMPYQCHLCKKRFRGRSAIVQHRTMAHGIDSASIYYCMRCKIEFSSQEAYIKHSVYHGGAQVQEVTRSSQRDVVGTARNSQSQSSLVQDSTAGRRRSQRNSNLNVSLRPEAANIEVTNASAFMCNYCGQLFLDVELLERHKQTHAVREPGATSGCQECTQGFTTEALLEDHRKTHTGGKGGDSSQKNQPCGGATEDVDLDYVIEVNQDVEESENEDDSSSASSRRKNVSKGI